MDITTGLSGGKQVTESACSPPLCPLQISPKHVKHFASLSLPFFHHVSVHPNAPKECGCLPPASTLRTQADLWVSFTHLCPKYKSFVLQIPVSPVGN